MSHKFVNIHERIKYGIEKSKFKWKCTKTSKNREKTMPKTGNLKQNKRKSR